MVIPVIRVVDRHRDKPPPVPGGAGHQNPPGSFRVAGFHAVCACHLPQQLIVVAQIAIAHGNCFGGDGFVENGVFHGIGGQNRQIPGGGVVSGAVQPVGIFKMTLGHTQHPGLVVHHFREALYSAAAVNGQSHRRVVAGMEHQPIQQLLECQNLPLLQIHGGAFDAHSLFGNPHPVQDVALLADHKSCHDLGGAGNQAPLVGILLIQNPSGGGIHQNCFFGGQRLHADREKQDGSQ